MADTGSVESLNRGRHFSPKIVTHPVWLHHQFIVSFQDVEDLLAEGGVAVSYEAIRLWGSQIRLHLCTNPAPPAWPAGLCLAQG